jgi:PKD repeat protein
MRTPRLVAVAGRGRIPPGPTASFTPSSATPAEGDVVTFTDTSTGTPTSWLWNFGDGTTSTSRNPTKTYTTAGSYTVTLTATNAGGSSQATTGLTVSAYMASLAGYGLGLEGESAYTDTGRTTLAAVNGDLIAGATDVSGNARHWSQATSGNRIPLRIVAGRKAFWCNNTSKTLATASFFDATWNTAFTVYFVKEFHGRTLLVSLGGNSTAWWLADSLNTTSFSLFHDVFQGGNGVALVHLRRGRIVSRVPHRYDGINEAGRGAAVSTGSAGDNDVSSAR